MTQSARRSRAPFVAHQIILKVASRCNLYCDYCHWFRDPEVYSLPKLMSVEIEDAFLNRLENYLQQSEYDRLDLVFHGGEPMLFPKSRYIDLAGKVRRIEQNSGKQIRLLMTTNGSLVDAAWASLLRELNILPCVSLDGTKEIHDAHRVDLNGKGSHDQVVRGLQLLRDAGFNPSVLTVCDPDTSPDELCEFLVDDLGVKDFDVLQPNFTLDDGRNGRVKSIAQYYIRLFDLWYDVYAGQGVDIRIIWALAKVVLGRHSGVQGLGLNAYLAHVVIQPNGMIEPHDVLRIGGNSLVRTDCNVLTNDLSDIVTDPVWLAAYHASHQPADACRSCEYLYACGGGEVMHRYSAEGGFNNPTVYCEDMKAIIAHVWQRMSQDLCVESRADESHEVLEPWYHN